jgi:hypothetical protein
VPETLSQLIRADKARRRLVRVHPSTRTPRLPVMRGMGGWRGMGQADDDDTGYAQTTYLPGQYIPPPDYDPSTDTDGGTVGPGYGVQTNEGVLSTLQSSGTSTTPSGGGSSPSYPPAPASVPPSSDATSDLLPSFMPATIAGFPTTSVLLAVAILVGVYLISQKKGQS